MGVAFHHKPTGDVLDDPNVSKSALYDIEPREIRILIPWSETFIADLVNGGDPMAAFVKGSRMPAAARWAAHAWAAGVREASRKETAGKQCDSGPADRAMAI
jgi:hypothetical protein